MEYLHSTLAGESANPSKSFFLCSLRFLLLIHFPFKVYAMAALEPCQNGLRLDM